MRQQYEYVPETRTIINNVHTHIDGYSNTQYQLNVDNFVCEHVKLIGGNKLRLLLAMNMIGHTEKIMQSESDSKYKYIFMLHMHGIYIY